jgi:hypothetical protein
MPDLLTLMDLDVQLKTKVPEMTFVGMFDDAIKTICAKVCQ